MLSNNQRPNHTNQTHVLKQSLPKIFNQQTKIEENYIPDRNNLSAHCLPNDLIVFSP
jgi:hypothetical protein